LDPEAGPSPFCAVAPHLLRMSGFVLNGLDTGRFYEILPRLSLLFSPRNTREDVQIRNVWSPASNCGTKLFSLLNVSLFRFSRLMAGSSRISPLQADQSLVSPLRKVASRNQRRSTMDVCLIKLFLAPTAVIFPSPRVGFGLARCLGVLGRLGVVRSIPPGSQPSLPFGSRGSRAEVCAPKCSRDAYQVHLSFPPPF